MATNDADADADADADDADDADDVLAWGGCGMGLFRGGC